MVDDSLYALEVLRAPSIGGHWNMFCKKALLPFRSRKASNLNTLDHDLPWCQTFNLGLWLSGDVGSSEKFWLAVQWPLLTDAYTLHPSPYTLHPAPFTLHPTPYTLHPLPYTLRPRPYTLNRNPSSLTPNP